LRRPQSIALLLSVGVELQVNPASGIRLWVIASASPESKLFITARRRNRPPELKSDRKSEREDLIRHGGVLPGPDRSALGRGAFHGVGCPYAAAGAKVVLVGCASAGMNGTTVTALAAKDPPSTVAVQRIVQSDVDPIRFDIE
jgi:hypothetical protein